MKLITDLELEKILKSINIKYEANLTKEDVIPMLNFAQIVQFNKGDVILGVGEPMKKCYLILNGIIRSYYLDIEGIDVTKFFSQEYTLCASDSMIINEKNSTQGYEALEDVTALEFDAKVLKDYMLSIPKLKDLYIQSLEKTVIYKMYRESSFQLESATERYIDFKHQYPRLEERVNQTYIASYLGITPVSLSRIRRTIREEN